MEENDIQNDGFESLQKYLEHVSEFAKSAETLLPVAVKLKDTPEWQAFKEVLLTKAAAMTVEIARDTTRDSDMGEKGKIAGILLVVDMVEKYLVTAMDKKKAVLLKKRQEENDLTKNAS